MAGCAACAGCCASCAASCGVFGGAALDTMGGSTSSGSLDYFLGGPHSVQDQDDDATSVDGNALVDPNHPRHREAVKKISHVDAGTHEKIIQRFKDILHGNEHWSGPQT
jgi:hypothetical protein